MNQKALLIAGGSLVVAAFLIGFIPQFLKARDLAGQLGAVRQQLISQRAKSQMQELGLLCGYVYLQTDLKNYGLASQSSTEFFHRAGVATGQTLDPTQQAFLQGALAKRDAITSGLAKGDPGTVRVLQDMFQSALKTTQTGPR